jgi:carbamoyl-phosphate synthase small subunit
MTTKTALLALEDGSIFYGNSIGFSSCCNGEVVFNTSMTGYQEILTDPSYKNQIVTLTYPHIGNTGVTEKDTESNFVQATGLVIKDLPLLHNNWRSSGSLPEYLKKNKIVAIAGVDTRALTIRLRDKGVMKACIQTENLNEKQAIKKAQDTLSMQGTDLAQMVSCKERYNWSQSVWNLATDNYPTIRKTKYKIVVLDFGVKHNILRILSQKGCDITVLNAKADTQEILEYKPDGVFLSNGPGDPAPCGYAIETIEELLKKNIPLFGICLGFQLLCLACGAKTYKMKFGHHGANHPVLDLSTKQVKITSQNHGFAVEKESLPDDFKITHISLFDKSVQGVRHKEKPVFGFQGHPEASPGPNDINYLFDEFINDMKNAKKN